VHVTPKKIFDNLKVLRPYQNPQLCLYLQPEVCNNYCAVKKKQTRPFIVYFVAAKAVLQILRNAAMKNEQVRTSLAFYVDNSRCNMCFEKSAEVIKIVELRSLRFAGVSESTG
jgi:hypothetical protein